jgi:DNA-binding transcriptional LysR family regulator
MDRVALMRSFIGVTRAQSFSEAARSLGISGSLVSRHVAELERDLGVRLVNRTARTVSLTEAGAQYATFASRIIEEMDDEDARLRNLRDKPEGTLSVISPKWIGSLDVGDAVAAFAMRYPKIRVRLDVGGMSDRNYDFLNHGYDVAFHTRHLRDSGLMLKKVADLQFVLCASEAYLAIAGTPATMADLADYDCLMNTNDPIWHLREDGHDAHFKVTNAVYSCNSYLPLSKAAVAGRGIALLPARPLSEQLMRGDLVAVLPNCEVPDRPLYALHSPGGQTLARVRLFLDFVAGWFRDEALRSVRPVGALPQERSTSA